MAHELDTRANGTAAFVSLRQTAWHQLGTVVGDELAYEEALDLGGLDYPLHLRPLTTSSPILGADGQEHDAIEVPVPSMFSVVRSDRHLSLGVVGDRYRIVDNREATQVVRALVEEGLARIETAGVLRDGADAWMALRFTGDRIDAAGENGGDAVKFYGMVRTNHSGQASVQIMTTPVRVVCANTLAMALSNGQSAVRKVRHSGLAGQKVVEAARDLWASIATDAEDMSRAFDRLRRTSLSPAQFARLLDTVAPLPTLAKDATSRSKALHESALFRVQTDRRTLKLLWEKGTGQRGAMTAWDAFNAVTEAIDHEGFAAPTRGEAKANPLAQQMAGGSLATLKATAWSTLLAMAV